MYNKRNLTEPIIEAMQNKKGRDITLIDLSAIEGASAAKFIICTGNTPTQVAAIADNVRQELLDRFKVKPYNYDGYRNSKWIVLDYGVPHKRKKAARFLAAACLYHKQPVPHS